ncbi:hypothetical protein SAY86_018096 [Trapa natans]|uniref:Thioredoxin domain-containing protein n=1 Tax=Trapa natans TaxID=22666 RepID=A0AAN7LIJ5_TRANT|nr:hypothetical protein SAY86_018096 [Trapa natans]
MAFPAAAALFLLLLVSAFSPAWCVSSQSPSPCPVEPEPAPFLFLLQSQCPSWIIPNPPLQVDGEFLDRFFSSKQHTAYTSVLFYAACCPFSHRLALKYNVLSSMFPQIVHLAVEQSSTTPSIFSRYGIHSVPSILWVNETSSIRYHGEKDLVSLVEFYKRVTGLEPVHDMEEDVLMRQDRSSQKGMLKREPFLMLSILFLCSRVLMMGLPRTLSWLKSFWTSCVSHVNLGIFGETSQILSGVLQMIDVRRLRMMLRHCKPQSFCGGTRNARVWASSLASVSQ